MKFKSIKLQNFRCFDKLELNFHNQLTLIIGKKESGKTAILDALAILLGIIPFSFDIKCNYIIKTDDTRIIQNNNSLNINYSYPIILSSIMYIDNMEVKYERKLNKPTGKCTFNSIRKITEILNDYQDRIIKGDTTVILPLVLYYNSQHQWFHFQEKNAVFPNNQRINGYINCINNNSGDKLMMNWFYKETLKKLQNKTGSTLFDKVIMTIEQCILFFIKDITDVKISYNFDNNDIEIQYKECNQNNTYLLSQWNDNYKYIIYIIIDILYRIAQLNPQLMNDVLNTPGIVIIDDIDNIFHFNLQKELLNYLTSTFPNIQFIISTNSSSIINFISNENLIILDN